MASISDSKSVIDNQSDPDLNILVPLHFSSLEAASDRLNNLPDNLGIILQNLSKQYGNIFIVKDFILCFFRILFPDGNPRRDPRYWFYSIC